MNPWIINPSWQNFSSMYREAVTAAERKDEATKYHHLTSALYFGIAFLEAYFNGRMRDKLNREKKTEGEISDLLRNTRFKEKLEEWPKIVTGKALDITIEAKKMVFLSYDIRGNLTHPKTLGHDIYQKLEEIDVELFISSIAQYSVRFCEALNEIFPYWIFGWNYLNPTQEDFSLILVNNQQFLFSLQALGFGNPAGDEFRASLWKRKNMSSFEGYLNINHALKKLGHCEPRRLTVYQPVLCRRWWDLGHIETCGGLDYNRSYLLD